MTDADLLKCAATLAEHQPSAPAAIRAAVPFLDHYPEALRIAEAEAGPDCGLSLALVLGSRCARRDEVARFFLTASAHCEVAS